MSKLIVEKRLAININSSSTCIGLSGIINIEFSDAKVMSFHTNSVEYETCTLTFVDPILLVQEFLYSDKWMTSILVSDRMTGQPYVEYEVTGNLEQRVFSYIAQISPTTPGYHVTYVFDRAITLADSRTSNKRSFDLVTIQ